jgi:hypothetical protein
MYENYNKKGLLYIIQSKLDQLDKYQLHLEPKSLMNNKDEPITFKYLYDNFKDEKLHKFIINLKLEKLKLDLSFNPDFDNKKRIDIEIDVDDDDIFNYFVNNYKDNDKINDYTYLCNDFSFVLQLPKLSNLNSKIQNTNIISIDLSPLSKIESIGSNFISRFEELKSINLSPLSNVKSIGHSFFDYSDIR